MDNPELEQQRKPNPGKFLNRYYSELREEKHSYSGLLLAAERLLDNEGLGEDDDTYDRLYGSAIPTLDQYISDRHASLETLTALPISLVSHWVDATEPIGEVMGWYETLIRRVASATPDHMKECYSFDPNDTDPDMSCACSTVCPRRLLAMRLQLDVLKPDFKSVGYMIEPYRTRSVALDKMEAAMRTKLITNQEFVTKATVYAFDFDRRFQSVPRPE